MHQRRIRPALLAAGLGLATLTLASALPAKSAPAAQAATAVCPSSWEPTYVRVNPPLAANLITPSPAEATASAARGFTVDRGAQFATAPLPGAGLIAVHRLQSTLDGDLVWITSPPEISRAVLSYHYRDDGIDFYAAASAGSCVVPVFRLYLRGHHRQTISSTEAAALAKAGWHREQQTFYVASHVTFPSDSPRFTFVAFPDTQQEDHDPSDPRFANRTQWVGDHKTALSIRFVAQVGDLVDWDTPDHIQYQIAAAAMGKLNSAGVPYAIAVGNHDGAAVCPGGSACPGIDVHAAIRDTSTLNAYFPSSSFADLAGEYPPGKIDNTFHVFTAAGHRFLVLSLELWPRPAVVSWAQSVVASHPTDNVIVVTHNYLTSGGGIEPGSHYGDTSPQYLYDHLVKVYPNVRMVLSGHTGIAGHRVDRGVHGNTVVSFLQTFHDNHTNPMRLIEIDARRGTVRSWIYCPYTGVDYNSYSRIHYSSYDTSIQAISWQ